MKSTNLVGNRGIFRILLGTALLALPLTGCFDPEVQQTVYATSIDTVASVYAEQSVGGTGLPWGVTLQVDPDVLVPCELEPGVDALLHVSQISRDHVEKPSDVLTVGQIIEAKIVDYNGTDRKISLSMKALQNDAAPTIQVPQVEEVKNDKPNSIRK